MSERPDLCAVACLKRVQEFMRDEIGRAQVQYADRQILSGMRRLADSVDELIADILRKEDGE